MSRTVRGVLIVLTVVLFVIVAHRHFARNRATAESPAVQQHEQSCPCGGH